MRDPTPDELELYAAARAAAAGAYAPYSGFAVGAAMRTASGEVITGVNIENASYGLTCCAERTAMFTAVAAGERDFTAIAVHGDASSVPPCGACRQVLAEFAPELVVVYRQDGAPVSAALAELLPARFEL
ncbi:MAG TPA: cytidine deaminase [Gaiellales bacterium]|nr:cytidine deaminase [Gaiellales bacterium]